ncbi:unnamed protein product [Penicillium salamii]|nr:unnamed protein product [Penicillium salamii]
MLWLSTHQFREQHVAILEGVKQGTGEWFVKHDMVQSWFEGKTGLLWCPGLPGAGKTHLMSLVVDTIESKPKTDDVMHAYIYCSYSRRKEQGSTALLSSLLLQVLQHSESETIPSEVLLLYNSHLKYGTRPTSKQLKGALEELIAAYKKFFVVIDALDECAESEQDTLEFLSVLRSVGSNVHILCSSRSSTTFEGYFSAADKLVILAREEDVGLVLDSEISRHPGLSRHVRADPSLRGDIITCINAECKGMYVFHVIAIFHSSSSMIRFLLAKLHVESLYNKITRKAVRLALLALPTTLDDTYAEALQRIYDQPSDTVDLAETVLLWVVCAHQPLTVAQLQHMHAMRELSEDMTFDDDDLPDGEILTGACGGLVSVDGESQTIQLIHYTAQNYFERSFAQKLMAARLSLTQISLAYLGLSNFESGFCTSDADMLQRLREYPFLEYAAKHWGSDMNFLDMDQLFSKVDRVFSNSTITEMTSQAWSISTSRYSNWSQEFPRNCPALVLASTFEVPVLLENLVASGHQVEGKGTDEETALIRAAKFGHTGNVRLLQKGGEVNSKDYMHETALQKAARMGHESVVRLLLDGGADVNTKASNSWSPLMSAVSSGSVGIVRMLVEAGAELTTETDWGSSALSMAIQSGQEDIAVFLADQGAVLPRGEVGRRTPMIASRRGFHRLVRLLTIDHRAITEEPLQHRASRLMSGVAECPDEASYDSRSDSAPENQASYEVSGGEFMEQYGIKTSFSRHCKRKVKIGFGTFSTVWLCHSKVTGVPFVVKRFRGIKPLLQSSDFGGINAEIELLHELKRKHHPNLIRMVDIFANLETNMLTVVLELAPAGDLFRWIAAKGKLGEDETRIIFSQLFSAIHFLVS